MKRLKGVFEAAGMQDVRTYINSGNVVFGYEKMNTQVLADKLERAIEHEFGFPVPTIVRSEQEMSETVGVIENEWLNDADMKCDILFLWNSLSATDLIAQLRPRDEIDSVRTVPGAIIWKVDRANAGRSGLMRIMGTPEYKQVTVRNCNTVRKLLSMLEKQVS